MALRGPREAESRAHARPSEHPGEQTEEGLSRGGTLDTDTAWTLLTTKGFTDAVTADDPDTRAEALDKVVDAYPWAGSRRPSRHVRRSPTASALHRSSRRSQASGLVPSGR
jgi:hypothetical protein